VARNKNQSFEKRKREQARQEKAAKKRAKRRARASTDSEGLPGDPDLEDVMVGPQDKPRPTEAEVQRAIELVMNPGKERASSKHSKPFGKRLFVGNIDRATEEHELGAFFRDAGFAVVSATLMLDRTSGESRGFAFVELEDADQAKRAMADLSGTALHGRELRINMADSTGRR
jgi:RNA recognition motif-containing protein